MKVVALGIVQGLTEFLPISSTGHLYIIKRVLGLSHNLLPLFVFLHLATLLAIVIFLGRDIVKVLFKKKILAQLGVITLITAVIGGLINGFLTDFFENKFLVAFFLLVNGVILLSIKNISTKRNYDSITLKDSLLLGLLQGLAIFPGISRSGITICGLLKKGFKPKEAFIISFLMAIPVISGAFLLKAKSLSSLQLPALSLGMGFFAAFISGFLALVVVKKLLASEKFSFFGYYCILTSLACFII